MPTIDYLRWSIQQGSHSAPRETTLDDEDLRTLAGAMARFPRFRPFGWELVRHAHRVR